MKAKRTLQGMKLDEASNRVETNVRDGLSRMEKTKSQQFSRRSFRDEERSGNGRETVRIKKKHGFFSWEQIFIINR